MITSCLRVSVVKGILYLQYSSKSSSKCSPIISYITKCNFCLHTPAGKKYLDARSLFKKLLLQNISSLLWHAVLIITATFSFCGTKCIYQRGSQYAAVERTINRWRSDGATSAHAPHIIPIEVSPRCAYYYPHPPNYPMFHFILYWHSISCHLPSWRCRQTSCRWSIPRLTWGCRPVHFYRRSGSIQNRFLSCPTLQFLSGTRRSLRLYW